jgi:hypothetical protein
MRISFSVLGFVLIIDRFFRAKLDTGHALLAVMLEIWPPGLIQTDVADRTDFFTNPTFNAII